MGTIITQTSSPKLTLAFRSLFCPSVMWIPAPDCHVCYIRRFLITRSLFVQLRGASNFKEERERLKKRRSEAGLHGMHVCRAPRSPAITLCGSCSFTCPELCVSNMINEPENIPRMLFYIPNSPDRLDVM